VTARSPAFPIALLLLVMPAASVLQFRAVAPLALAALVATVLAAWRAERRLPRPRGAALWAALALFGWAAASAGWALEPRRALLDALSLGGFALLGAAAAGAVARCEEAAKRRLALWLAAGLAAGVGLAVFDQATGHAVRAAVRGLDEAPATLGFGLKPAVTVFAVLLPLTLAAPIAAWLRVALAVVTVAAALWLPAESAKLAILAGLAGAGLAALAPRMTFRLAAAGLAVLILAAPPIFTATLGAGPPAERLPPSAAHRLVIWDFALTRIAERPIAGWGMEASRAVPGGRDTASPETLARLGLTSAASAAWFARPAAQRLPLHPHNGPLQVWLELGLVGAVLASLLVVLLAAAARRRPEAMGALFAAAVVGCLSYGIWQGWWIALLLVLAAAASGLPAGGRRPAA
jgi:O-antigen ligase